MENLAPAGNWEALERAIAAGADAVYLGYAAFSARAGAGNFDAEQLEAAVRLAHLHHVRVHVTVNTLVKDAELPEVLDVLRLLNRLRVDAVLVQDLGVLRLARCCFPDLPIHASTQMALHNATGARWARKMGMKRVVLARECSVAEIARCAGEPIEIEVFGHGAQCVAVSGECLFSSMVGERSGNRGRCAQPCRQTYSYRGQKGAWLSPRDVCLRDHLPALQKAGACSIKLEGRLKRPEYVAVVASSYRKGLDSLAQGRFLPADKEEKRGLMQIFQRGGFMRGYAMGAEDAAVIDPSRVNHGGVDIGVVQTVRGGLAQARLDAHLNDGDQLRLCGARGDAEMIYAGHDVPSGAVATLRLRPDMRVQPGDRVVRLADESQLRAARAMPMPKIRFSAELIAMPGKPLTLTVTDGACVCTEEGGEVARAEKQPLTAEDARRSLDKTGGTPFSLADCRVYTQGAFVAASALNALRRKALDSLAGARAEAFARPAGEEKALPEDPPAREGQRADLPDTVLFRTAEQLPLAKTLGGAGARLVWFPEDWRIDALSSALEQMPEGVWLQLPMVCEEETLLAIHRLVCANSARLGGVVLGSVGQLGLAWPVPYGAGTGIPVLNREAARLLMDEGCAFATISCEATGRETDDLAASGLPLLMPSFGRVQLMLLHHCPARTYLGLKDGHAACVLCDTGAPDALRGTALTEARGHSYPLLRLRLPEGCQVRLMNDLSTDLRAQAKRLGIAQLMELTTETTAADLNPGRATQGHFTRPVE